MLVKFDPTNIALCTFTWANLTGPHRRSIAGILTGTIYGVPKIYYGYSHQNYTMQRNFSTYWVILTKLYTADLVRVFSQFYPGMNAIVYETLESPN